MVQQKGADGEHEDERAQEQPSLHLSHPNAGLGNPAYKDGTIPIVGRVAATRRGVEHFKWSVKFAG
jgi:hypothetical protein